MLRSEGLGVPLGGSRGLGSASVGLLRAWECFWGALGGLWLQNSSSAQNRIIRSNSKNTDIYVINTIRRIIRLRRMTHPWLQASIITIAEPILFLLISLPQRLTAWWCRFMRIFFRVWLVHLWLQWLQLGVTFSQVVWLIGC